MNFWTVLIDRAFLLEKLVLERREKKSHASVKLSGHVLKSDGVLLNNGGELVFIEASRPEDEAHRAADLYKLAQMMKHVLVWHIISRIVCGPVENCRVYGICTAGMLSAHKKSVIDVRLRPPILPV